MRCCILVAGAVLLGAALGERADDDGEDVRELDRKGWRAVESFPEENSRWIPRPEFEDPDAEVFPRRRRLRKRKRRPPLFSYIDEESEIVTERQRPKRRRYRPRRPEFWDEMADEPARPYVRRRITPAYDETHEDIISVSENSNANVLGATINVEKDTKEVTTNQTPVEQTTQRESNSSNLKALLTQSGGISLSEILQKGNLSLTDLLMGDQKTMSILTELPQSTTQANVASELETESTKHQRLPQSEGLKTTLNRNFEQDGESFETLSTKETEVSKRKRVPFSQRYKPTKVSNYEVVTEPTTEKRIFVPAHPKYYTSLDYKPDIDLFSEQTTLSIQDEITIKEETTTPKDVLTTISRPSNYKSLLEDGLKSKLPMTNSKINKLLTARINKEQNNPPTTLPPKAIKISVDEIFGLTPRQIQTEKKDEPLRMKIDLENLTEKTTARSTIAASSNVYKKWIKTQPTVRTSTSTTSTTTTTEQLVISVDENKEEKRSRMSAKEEIGEILKDPIGREHLSRILRDRNMTIDELIDQRERGSSQVHLADLFHNKNKEPEPKDEPLVGQINPKYFQTLSANNDRQPKNLFNSTEAASSTESKEVVVTSFPTFKIELHKDANKTQSFLWRELYPDLFKNVHESNSEEDGKVITENYIEEIKRLDDIENTYLAASKENLNANENSYEEGVFINIPTGVKSAVLASFAIIGLSLVVFLTILIVFRWTQKQRRKLNYCGPSLSAKINPILENGPRNLKTFVTETLGRKKNYYKNHLQSMSDSIWENARKPSF